jgi:hypothetical protein
MQLLFREKSADEVEQEVTQRDQFNSDEVTLTATLVRETNQNSLDAKLPLSSSPVRVRMRFVTPGPSASGYFGDLFTGLKEHLTACEVDFSGLNLNEPRLLVIEDFGTTGLTGNWNETDNGAFSDFWRRIGKSHKGGNSNGRWGLGKLVFSSSSRIRTFFGVTRRENDIQPLLMGQVVLSNHTIKDKKFAPHGFFAIPAKNGLQLPVTDSAAIKLFCGTCGVTRIDEPGLSIVIPCILEEIKADNLISEVVRNYFFPVLTGQLEVEVEGQLINAANFSEVAAKYSKNSANSGLMEFIRALQKKKDLPPDAILENTWAKDIETALDASLLAGLRDSFAKGGLTHVRFPITLKRKDGTQADSYFDLFLKHANEDQQGEAIFVRSAITVPDEARFFRGHQVFGALVASQTPITSFLGDAENPAHTRWNGSAEKLEKNWKAGKQRLREIRNSLNDLYKAVTHAVETSEENALIDVFFIPDDAEEKIEKEGKHRKTDVPPMPPVTPSPKLYRIVQRKGGFSIKSGPALSADKLPLTVKVRAAYDSLKGDPFKQYNSLDFDFMSNDLQILATGATSSVIGSNEIFIEAASPEFTVDIKGFDEHRDLLVKATK